MDFRISKQTIDNVLKPIFSPSQDKEVIVKPEYGFASEREAEVVHQLQSLLRALVEVVEEGRQLLGGVVLPGGAGNLPDAAVDVGDGALGCLKVNWMNN